MTIPQSFANGVLPPGTYEATFDQIRQSILVKGMGSSASWDSIWRSQLVDQAEILTRELWSAGIYDVFLDGSFVEEKDRPNDIDGYFDTGLSMMADDLARFSQLVHKLNFNNPYKIWDWNPHSRVAVAGSAKRQLPMWVRYRVELYPHLQQSSGIMDKYGNELTFPSAFRQCRGSGKEKGIVKIIRESGHDQNRI